MNPEAVPNSWFQFKQFRVNQSASGMKVTTEGCILGGVAAKLNIEPVDILDVGAGTGLLSLMLAQRFDKAKIQAVEIDELAAAETTENFKNSPWAERLTLKNQRIQDYHASNRFDLIISNPPFYKQSLQSNRSRQNQARHDDSLSAEELLQSVNAHLSPQGIFLVLYPQREMKRFTDLAMSQGLFLKQSLSIYNHDQSAIFRQIGIFSRKDQPTESDRLNIRNTSDQQYTAPFIDLLKDYYLHL